MAGFQEYPLLEFGPVGKLQDSTQLGKKLVKARNVLMRPLGALKGPPVYFRLWAIGNATTIRATLAALTYTPYGGSPRAINTGTDDTIAVRIAKDGKNWLLLYSFPESKCKGLFYMGDDGTFTGTPDFTTGTPSYEVLAVGLDPAARWYGTSYYGALYLGNGVDDNVVVQLTRTANPGKWRKAASNARPAAAVLRALDPSGNNNAQASYTIYGGAVEFALALPVGCTASASTDKITCVNHGLIAGMPVQFDTSGTLPSGISASTNYYVRDVTSSTFKIAATAGGSAINLTTDGTGDLTFQSMAVFEAAKHPFTNGATVTLTTSDTLPTGLALATTYYVVNKTSDTFQLSTSSGGAAIGVTSAGLGIHKATSTGSGKRAGHAALTFTAQSPNFPGTAGHNIFVAISYDTSSSAASGITSTMSGNGTVSDPYHYTIKTVAGVSSNDDIVAFVLSDTNAIGILTASTSSADGTNDSGSWALTALSGGVDGGASSGFSNKTCSVYLRYWDVGQSQLGYEGISSDKSNELILDATTNKDVEVLVTPNSTAEGGRFGYIRIYLQFGEDELAQWNLVAEVPNTSGSGTFTREAGYTCTASATTDRITRTAHGLTAGTKLRFASTISLPGGISGSTTYYVRDVTTNNFRLATSATGAAINLTTNGSGTITYRRVTVASTSSTKFQNGAKVRATTSGTLPTGLALATDYYVVNAAPGIFGLSATVGGSPIELTSDGAGTHTLTIQSVPIVIGSDTLIGQEMYVDQHRPLPSKLCVMAGGKLWHGGVTEYPNRVYPSKDATTDELVPEGANNQAFELVLSGDGVNAQEITAMFADDFRLHCHQKNAVVMFPPGTPENTFMPPVMAGAINNSAVVTWTHAHQFYLGGDLNLYQFNSTRYGKRDVEFASLDAAAYVRDLIDTNAVADNADRVFMFPDIPGQLLWYWLPAKDGSLVGFAYDFLLKGTVGPMEFPKVYQMGRMEVERTEYVFADESGNLFVWDTATQADHNDTINGGTAPSAPTIHTAGSASGTVSNAGYNAVAVTGGEYWRASTSEIETGFLDMGKPSLNKAFAELTLTSIAGSRGLLAITITGKNTRAVSRYYGDIADKGQRQSHKVQFAIQDTAVKIKIAITSGEQCQWNIRDAVLRWKPTRPL